MQIHKKEFSRLSAWRISLAGLCLVGRVVAQNFGEWSVPVNLGASINSAANDQ